MNPVFISIAIAIIVPIVQMGVFIWLRSREEGRKEEKIDEAAKLSSRVLKLERQMSWLYGNLKIRQNGGE